MTMNGSVGAVSRGTTVGLFKFFVTIIEYVITVIMFGMMRCLFRRKFARDILILMIPYF